MTKQICCGVPMVKVDNYTWACEQCPGMILLTKPEEETKNG